MIDLCYETSINLKPVAERNKVSAKLSGSGDGAHGVQGEGGMDYEVLNQNDDLNMKEYLNLQ